MSGAPPAAKTAPVARRAACALALATGLLAILELAPDLQRLFEPLNLALSRATELALGHLDVPVSRQGAVLAHPDGFSYRITYVCSGLRPAVLVFVALLAVPAGWPARIAGAASALCVLEALNLCRLTHLYWTGVTDPDGFFLAHRVIWNVVFILAVAGFLAVWLSFASRVPREKTARRRTVHVHA